LLITPNYQKVIVSNSIRTNICFFFIFSQVFHWQTTKPWLLVSYKVNFLKHCWAETSNSSLKHFERPIDHTSYSHPWIYRLTVSILKVLKISHGKPRHLIYVHILRQLSRLWTEPLYQNPHF